jgi:hypothetical protein
MYGPEIMARSMSALSISDQHGNRWQYHSRSDAHSKIACWAILFDLMLSCQPLRQQIASGSVGFGINHELHDFQTRRRKNLDLVVCSPASGDVQTGRPGKKRSPANSFAELADAYAVILSSTERKLLAGLPVLPVVPVGSVYLALEAKATMTAHIKALPRLHDELDSSHLTVHGHADHAIAAALITINVATEFTSPDRNKYDLSRFPRNVSDHSQPRVAERTITKVHELRRRTSLGQAGFDAVGIVLVNFRNDGTPCEIVTKPPAPAPSDPFYYDQMIARLVSLYQAKFPTI